MEQSYSKNYIKIYFWRIISLVSGFLSLFIVVPHLSDDVELYGIYAFCISFTMYLTYADIGFLGAGQKYAAEAFARGNRKEEVDMLGFTGAILLFMIAPFSLTMIYFSYNPEILINSLSTDGKKIASSIFLILGIALPIQIILQRLVQSILVIRIKEYISMKIDVIFNLIKIASVFYFFSEGNYMIVQYYLFITVATIISSIIILFIIQKSESYNFIDLLKAIKLSKKQYNITKKLAYSSLFLTVGWLIYYELDLIIIGKWFGSNEVALYAIGFTFLNFLRTLWNSVFSPFAQRFNHLIGTKSQQELKKLIKTIIDYTFPLCVIITVTLVVISKQLVLFWVGDEYLDSILVLKVLIIGTVFGFITNPAGYYFSANTKYKYMYLSAILLPVAFLVSLFILAPNYGVLGISISKSFAMFVGFIISVIGLLEIYNSIIIIKKWFINLAIISISIIYFLPLFLNFIFNNLKKSTPNLIILFFIAGTIIVISYVLILLTKEKQRKELKFMLITLKDKLPLKRKSTNY